MSTVSPLDEITNPPLSFLGNQEALHAAVCVIVAFEWQRFKPRVTHMNLNSRLVASWRIHVIVSGSLFDVMRFPGSNSTMIRVGGGMALKV